MLSAASANKPYSLADGERLVRSARYAIELHLTTKNLDRRIVEEGLKGIKGGHGVFVTITHYPNNVLRGCIGVAKPVENLGQALVDMAIAAATGDPRFVPVSHREFEHMVIGVNVLAKPEKMHGTATEMKKAILVGRDGLMIEYGYNTGLLLPIVAVEEGWSAQEFLENVCAKAGLGSHMWRNRGASLYKFSSQVFRESSPNGPVEELDLSA